MGRNRKLFTGNKPVHGVQDNSVKSRRQARKVTSAYHRLQNEIASSTDRKRILELQSQLIDAGGVDRYQQASVISTSHFKTSRWVVRSLFQLQSFDSKRRLNALEVGAINTQLHACKHLSTRSIDLNSQHPLIEEIDFFDIEPRADYDVVVCSMVINCVPLPEKRGEMLARLKGHLKATGILFLVIPTRCMTSRHVGGVSSFMALLGLLGLQEVEHDSLVKKETPKLSFFVLKHAMGTSEINWRKNLRDVCIKLKVSAHLRQFITLSSEHFVGKNKMISSTAEFSLCFKPLDGDK